MLQPAPLVESSSPRRAPASRAGIRPRGLAFEPRQVAVELRFPCRWSARVQTPGQAAAAVIAAIREHDLDAGFWTVHYRGFHSAGLCVALVEPGEKLDAARAVHVDVKVCSDSAAGALQSALQALRESDVDFPCTVHYGSNLGEEIVIAAMLPALVLEAADEANEPRERSRKESCAA